MIALGDELEERAVGHAPSISPAAMASKQHRRRNCYVLRRGWCRSHMGCGTCASNCASTAPGRRQAVRLFVSDQRFAEKLAHLDRRSFPDRTRGYREKSGAGRWFPRHRPGARPVHAAEDAASARESALAAVALFRKGVGVGVGVRRENQPASTGSASATSARQINMAGFISGSYQPFSAKCKLRAVGLTHAL